ncbi:hypothetical protein BDC45DRAFT_601958 [Circinella umbellata]|nr:hypothetical protein BDC45DRAFT_601958 [Circinella umbellata]
MLQKNKPTTITTTVGLATLAMTMLNTLQVLAQNENDFDSLPVNDLGIEEENQEQEQTGENNGEEEEVEEETWDEEDEEEGDGSTTQNNNEDQTQGKNYENNDDDENSDSLMELDTEEDESPQPEIIGTLGKDNEPPTDYAPEVLDVAGNEDEEDSFGDEEDEEENDEYKQTLLQQQEQRQDDEELKQELAEEDSQSLQQNEEDFKMKDEEALLNQQLVEEQYDSNDGVVIDSNDITVDEQQEEEQQQQEGDVDDNDTIPITTPTTNKQQIEENNDLDQELANEGFEEDEELISQVVQPLPIPPITQEQQQKERIGNKEWETNDEYTIQNQAIYQNEWTEGDDLGKEQELEQQQDKDEADLSDIPSAEPQPNVKPVIPELNGEEQDDQPLQPLPIIDDDNKVTDQYDHNIDQSLEKALEMDAANIPWYEDSNAKDENPDFLKENNLSKEQNIMQGHLPGGITNGDNPPVLTNADYNMSSSSSSSSRRSSMLIMLIFIFMILFILRKRWLKIITRQKNSSTLPVSNKQTHIHFLSPSSSSNPPPPLEYSPFFYTYISY